ncbi:hypothetical protein HK100_006601 [Physocladia obscura]|uniref:Uncharacterized protein n=1 Tax=Physocladia obscura TaxID=109957 RepID=A0AAD5X8Q3_9FUNG|nr:hypothetical protein HK100_006601 [Physocladia obscura]
METPAEYLDSNIHNLDAERVENLLGAKQGLPKSSTIADSKATINESTQSLSNNAVASREHSRQVSHQSADRLARRAEYSSLKQLSTAEVAKSTLTISGSCDSLSDKHDRGHDLMLSHDKHSSVEQFEKGKIEAERARKNQKLEILKIQEKEAFEKARIAKEKIDAEAAAKHESQRQKIVQQELDRSKILEEQRIHMEKFELEKERTKMQEEEKKTRDLRVKEAEAFARLEELKRKTEEDEAKKHAAEEEKKKTEEILRVEKLKKQEEAMLMSPAERETYLAKKEAKRFAELEAKRLEEERIVNEALEKERLVAQQEQERIRAESVAAKEKAKLETEEKATKEPVDHTEHACCAKKCLIM